MIRLAVLITAVLAVAAAAPLLDHSGPAAHSSKQQKKAAEGAEVLVKKQLIAAPAAGKQEEVGLQQLTKRWGSRFSKARARSHGERSATVNERVARDYFDDDDDDDFKYDDANEGIDYRQTRDYTHLLGLPSLNKVQQQQHKLASRGILASRSEEANKKRSNLEEVRKKRLLEGGLMHILSGKQVVEMKRKTRNEKVENNKLVEKDYVGMIDDEDDKVKKVERKETEVGRVSRNYLDGIFGGDQETEERVSRDYLQGILGKEEEQKRVSRDYIYTFLGDGEDRERVSRDYLETIFGGGGLGERQSRDYMEDILGEDDQKRVSRDYLDVIFGGGYGSYGSSHNSDPYGSSHSSYPYGTE